MSASADKGIAYLHGHILEFSTLAGTIHDDYHMNNDNKQIHNWELRSYKLVSRYKGIASFSHGPLREFTTPVGTIQNAATIPTSNPNSWLMDESWHERSTPAKTSAIPTLNPDCMHLQIKSVGGLAEVLASVCPAKTGATSQHPPRV